MTLLFDHAIHRIPDAPALGGELGNAPLCACERIDAAER
jgi:hypothetical protein